MSEENMGDDKGINFLAQAGAKPEADKEPEQEPEFENFESKNIHSARRLNDGTVQIRFKNRKTGGVQAEYHYDGISEDTFEAMRSADSVGEFFEQNIKSNPKAYPFRKHEADKA